MAIRVKVWQIKFNYGAWNNEFHTDMKDMLDESIRTFLKEVIKHVPVYTGMAQGTLIPLNRAVHAIASIPDEEPDHEGSYHGMDKSPELGAQLSKYKRYYRKGSGYSLSFEPGLDYYNSTPGAANDEGENPKVPGAGYWFSLEDGSKAMIRSLEKQIRAYKKRGGGRRKVSDYIRVAERG